MAETVGRVDYIANLDGRDLPRQVRQMGDRAGKDFSKSFDRNMRNTFDRQITDVGDRAAATLSKKGKLAGERFATTFDRATSSKFRRIQENLANILSDRDSFAKYARGFDTVGDAVQRVEEDLKRLRDEDVKFQDSIGRTRTGVVLTKDDLNRFSAEAKRMGIELERVVAKEDEAAAATARMRDRVIELESQHRLLQRRIGNVGAFDRYAQRVGGTGNAFRELNKQIDDMGLALGHTNADMEISKDRLLQVRTASDRATASLDRGSESAERFSLHWKDLSHNTRQWTLIIGAVAAGIQDLAVLSSAAGAGVLALGGALGSGVVGLGGFVAAFSVLNKDLGEVPEHMRGVISQFDSFKTSAVGVRDVIASSAFRQMPDAFARLDDTTKALSPEFSRLGTVVGQVFDEFSTGLKVGSRGFAELRTFISNGTEDFRTLARVSGTWAVALLRGINRANPLVDQLIGYVGKLGDRFNDFTRSNSFDDWVQRSVTTFSKLGQLLDATGRMLNDLVTPESVVRTQKFLDNLTAFMPNLGRMLDIIGRLDVFGLVAQLLNEFGEALRPIEPAVGQLAEALNAGLSVAISVAADAIGAAATVIAPFAQGLADLVSSVPPGALVAIAGGITLLATSTKILGGVSGLLGLVQNLALGRDGMYGFLNATDKARAGIDTFSGKLGGLVSRVGGVAATVGLAVIAVEGIGEAVAKEILPPLSETTAELKKAKTATDIWAAAYRAQGMDGQVASTRDQFKQLGSALQDAVDHSNNWFDSISGANDGILTLVRGMGDSFAELAQNDLPAASEQFLKLADAAGLTKDQQLEMLNQMGPFRDALLAASQAQGEYLSSTELLGFVTENATAATGSQEDVIRQLGNTYDLTGAQVDVLSSKMQAFAEKNLSARSAARDYEASIDNLTQSLVDNGNTLDIGTEKGRANESAIDALAQSVLDYSNKTKEQTGSQAQANNIIAAGREELIRQLAQFGITGQAAEDYANKLGLVPSDINTKLSVTGAKEAEEAINKAARDRNSTIRVVVRQDGSFKVGGKEITAFATGGTVLGPTRALIGEAGPEAVVPLNRPLAQVDPSVRALSAIAQGKVPALAAGGIGGAQSKTVIFEAGAIVVQGADDPRRAALEVADEVADRIGS